MPNLLPLLIIAALVAAYMFVPVFHNFVNHLFNHHPTPPAPPATGA